MKSNHTILLAGGTGLIGQNLVELLKSEGHKVHVLTRSDYKKENHFHWSPNSKEIDENSLENVDIIINLAGAGIADKRWTEKRKEDLISSRVETTDFLYQISEKIPNLKQYVTASGINCYGYDHYDRKHKESDRFGDDFLSEVVEKWENAADQFKSKCKVAKVRTSVVLTKEGGALPKIAKTVKNYIGAPIGSGKQWMPWISMDDINRVYEHIVSHQLDGSFNALAESVTNKYFTQQLAKALNKPLWLPNVPSFILKLALGEMSSVVLDGLQADNTKVLNTGFEFNDTSLESLFEKEYN
jgi:uncharacterized protein (TIGR01777 family)